MPQLLVTTVFEGSPVGDLVPGRPVPGVAVDVGTVGRDIVRETTADDGSCTIELADVGEWTVAVDSAVEGGRLRAFRTVRVAGPFALVAVPVRFHPD